MPNEPDPQQDFYAAAAAAIRHADRQEPRKPISRRRLLALAWRMPSFGTWESWSLFEATAARYEGDERLARHVACNPANDLAELVTPGLAALITPSLTIRDRLVAADACSSLLDSPPVAPLLATNELVGVDGITSGFSSGDLSLEWWSDGPSAWREAIQWVSELRREIADLLRAGSPIGD